MELPLAKTGNEKVLLVEGGGMKGAFASGVLSAMCDYFPSRHFDLVVGVSSGTPPLAYYVTDSKLSDSNQKILDIWKYDLIGNKFIAFRNVLKGKKIMNQKYLIDYLLKEKYPILIERLKSVDSTPFYIVVSDIKNATPRYIQATSENLFQLLKAATSLPIVTQGMQYIDNLLLGDGAALDPIPIEHILEKGYKNITVILNQPLKTLSDPINKLVSLIAYPVHREFRRRLRKLHHRNYNKAKEILINPPKDVTLSIIEPGDKSFLNLISTKKKEIHKMIHIGWKMGKSSFEIQR